MNNDKQNYGYFWDVKIYRSEDGAILLHIPGYNDTRVTEEYAKALLEDLVKVTGGR